MVKKLLVSTFFILLWWLQLNAQVTPPCPSPPPPGAESCQTTCVYCNFDGYMGINNGTPSGGNTVCGQIAIHNDQWFGFIAGSSSITINIATSNCQNGDGLQAAFFENCADDAVECNPGGGGGAGQPLPLTWNGFVPGQTYYLMIDGWVGDICDYEIEVLDGSVSGPNPGNASVPQGPTQVCPGAVVTYTIPDVFGAGYYIWTAPPGSSINGGPPTAQIAAPDGTTITVTFGNAGGQVCVRAGNACFPATQQFCLPVVNQPIPPTILPKVTVCPEDFPYTLPWGDEVNGPGTFQITYDSWLGCDSVVKITVQQPVIPPTNLGQKVMCEGQCFFVCGTPYCDGGTYSIVCESFQGCDSIVNFSLIVLDPVAEILGGGNLSCSSPTITLGSTPTNVGIKTWRTLTGTVLGTGNNLTVTSPGTIILTCSAIVGGVQCTQSDTVTIGGNNTPPLLTATGGVIGCTNASVTLTSTTNATNPTYSWTSNPPGFTSNLQNPVTTIPGTYTVVVTNPANNCTNSATVDVQANNTPPVVTTTGNTITCTNPAVTINANVNVPTANYSWIGPGGVTYNTQNPTVTASGTYTVTVTNTNNGCSTTATASVALNTTAPGATATTAGVISCPTPTIVVNGGTTSGTSYSWTGPGGFTSSLQNPTVDTAGTYILTTTGANGCTSSASLAVTGNTVLPTVSAAGDTVDCDTPNINLAGGSTTTGVTYSWSGPNSFTSSQQNPSVTAVGLYTLTVTGTNSCTATATAIVDGDFAAPNASAAGGIITCSSSNVNISGNSTTPGVVYEWSGPGNFSSNLPTVNVNTVGTYILVVTSANGCTTSATADVTPDANIPNAAASGGTLDCNVTTLVLDGSSSTAGVSLSWVGPNGFTSTLEDPTITESGTYVLTVNNPANGCSAQATAIVDLDIAAPGATITGATITCTDPTIPLNGGSTAQNVTWDWTGPNGFTSTAQSPTINDPGQYILTVTGANGCTSTALFDVPVDQNIPQVTSTTGTLTCALTTLVLDATTTLPVTYSWTGPNGFASTLEDPSVTEGGDYTVTVTASNGCTDVETVPVAQDIVVPGASTTGNTINCTNPQVQISATTPTQNVQYNWSGPLGFTSVLPDPQVLLGGDYTVTITGQNGCISTSVASVQVDTNAAVVAAISLNTLTCSVTSVGIQANIIPQGSPIQTISWTGPNGFTDSVEDPNVGNPGNYTMVVTTANGCTSQTQVAVSQNITPPDVSATGNTLTCTITSIGIDGSSTTPSATYGWTGPASFTSALEDPTVTIDGVYTLTVTGPNGCTATAQATVLADVAPPGASSAHTNDLDCDDLNTTLQGSSATNNVSYKWAGPNSFTSALQNATASAPGTYTVTVTGANGCTSTAEEIVLQDIAAPNVSAAGDTLDCISGIANLIGGSSTNNVTYAWSGPNNYSSNLQNPTATVAGSYTVTVTGQNACTSTSVVNVVPNLSSPVVNVSGGGTLTCAITTLPITGTISTPNTTSVWTGPNGFTSNQAVINVTAPGTYNYTVTSTTNGCISTASMTVLQNITAPQNVTSQGGLLNCNFPVIAIQSNTTTTGVTYSWSGPGNYTSTQQNPNNVTNPGVYTVVITNTANGCTSTSSATVTQDPTVPDIAVTTEDITCFVPTVVLDAESNTAGVTYSWSGPNNFSSTLEDPAGINVPGTYTVVAKATSGCTASFSIDVVQNTTPPGASAAGDTITCTAQSGQILATSGTNNVSYAWGGPGGFTSAVANPTVTLVGNYTVTITNSVNGCTSTALAVVSPDLNAPQISATGGTVTCAVTSIGLTATSNVPVSWQWSGPGGFTSTQQNPTVTQAGGYIVVATATNGCSVSSGANVLADVQGPSVSVATPDKLDCTTTQVSLNASVQGAGNYGFVWSTANGNILSGANSQSPVASQAGLYNVVVTNNQNGCTTTSSVSVEVDPATPSGAIVETKNIRCYGETNGAIFIKNIEGGTPPYLYSLDNRPLVSGTAYTALTPGPHSLLVQDANGCEYETTISLTQPDQFYVNLGPDTTIHLGQSIGLSVADVTTDPARISRLVVNPDGLFPGGGLDTLLTPTYSLRYTVTAIDSNGCKAADSRLVIVDKTRYVYIPNVFAPASNNNNIFMIFGGEDVVSIKRFQVFDRWGSMVHEYYNFAPNLPASGWDGKVNGELATPAIFVYYAEILFKDGETILYKGDVLLER